MLTPSFKSAITQGKGYRILRANVSATLDSYGLTMASWTFLALLQAHPAMRMADIASELGVDAPLVTRLVKELEECEMLSTQEHPEDSRAKQLVLTERSQLLLPQVEIAVQKNLEPLIKGITIAELETYFKVLETIIASNGE